jgi:hypothetical protein
MKHKRALAWTLAALVLLLVFAAYLRPDMAMTLATQLWNCF